MPRATDKYKVNEIFYSIQGEGANTGHAAIFVRFSGCNLKCRFCDTDHSKYRLVSEAELIRKIEKISEQTGCTFVIFTGGEPLCQPVERVARKLREDETFCPGFKVALETNGTYPITKTEMSELIGSIDFDWKAYQNQTEKANKNKVKVEETEITCPKCGEKIYL